VDASFGNPYSGGDASGLAQALPKIWIGYLLCIATFVAELIVVANHPEIASGQLFIPPLPLFLLAFVSFVYWLVCVHKLHEVLAHVPGWKHAISPARAVWFHFIPIYSLYWLYKWPAETARFVNWKLDGPALKPRKVGILVLASYILAVFLGPGGLILVFFAVSRVNNWVRRALMSTSPVPRGPDSPQEGLGPGGLP